MKLITLGFDRGLTAGEIIAIVLQATVIVVSPLLLLA